ncbi:MAG: carbohydrate kinase family protein [Thermodesulfobacteriota bacterium]
MVPRLLVCGAINWDTTLFVDSLPKPGEEVKVNRVLSFPGGKGANTAVAAARILGKNKVGIIGMVGSDEIGEKQITILNGEGVDVSCSSRHKDLLSGQAYVVVDSKGENMVLTHRAANKAITLDAVGAGNIAAAIESSSMMIIIDPPLEVATELATRANTLGKLVMLSPATLVNHGYSALETLLCKADYLILNEHEAMSLAEVEDGRTACEKLSARLSGKRVITTLGSDGCIVSHEGKNRTVPAMGLSLFGLNVASTVGAGDTFGGAFSSFKLMGMADLEATFLANVAAALKITREQTRGSPTYEEIRKYVESDALRPIYEKFKVT